MDIQDVLSVLSESLYSENLANRNTGTLQEKIYCIFLKEGNVDCTEMAFLEK